MLGPGDDPKEGASVSVSANNQRIKILLSTGGDNAPYAPQTGDVGYDVYINGSLVGRTHLVDGNDNDVSTWAEGESIYLSGIISVGTGAGAGTTNIVLGAEYDLTVQIMGTVIHDSSHKVTT